MGGRGERGLTSLHRAVGNAHEDVAATLLERFLEMARTDAFEVQDELGRTCLEFAREQDLGPAARRIKAAFEVAKEEFALRPPPKAQGRAAPQLQSILIASSAVAIVAAI